MMKELAKIKKSIILIFLLVIIFKNSFAQQIAPQSLGSPINTKEFREHAFSISGDGKTFVFVQDRPTGTQIFFCTRSTKNAAWSKPQAIPSISSKIVSGKSIQSTSLTFDGSQLYFSGELFGGLGESDIYYVNRNTSGTYGEPQSVGEPLNTVLLEAYPSIAADGKTLFFVRDNFASYKNTLPCYAIWKASKAADGTWKNFEKLPETINSDCERAGFLLPNGHALLFSSIRPGGKGGFDTYFTEQKEDDTWTSPQALDFFNTVGDDVYTQVSEESDSLYFERNGDIYRTFLPKEFRGTQRTTLQFTVIDAFGKQIIPAKIIASNTKSTTETLLKNGLAKINLAVGENYTITCVSAGYQTRTLQINLNEKNLRDIQENTIDLVPLATSYSFHILGKEETVLTNPTIRLQDTTTQQNVALDAKNTAVLNFGKEYSLKISFEGYQPFSTKFTANPIDIKDKFSKTYTLTPLPSAPVVVTTVQTTSISSAKQEEHTFDIHKPSETYKLKSDATITYDTKKAYLFSDITFEKNSTDIQSDFYVDINRLIELLTLNPNLNVLLLGYTETSGEKEAVLSEKRAKACEEYLSRGGIEEARMQIKTYSEAKALLGENVLEDKNKVKKVKFILY